jgi:hypothetical protein
VKIVMRAVLCFAVAAACAATLAAAQPVPVQLLDLVKPLPPSVHEWSAEDVERWVNRTLGYPEYAAVVRTHLLDGPALLYVDLEAAFNPQHPIHLAKMRAHVDILRRRCLCSKRPVDFWSYLEQETALVWCSGTGAVFTPRLSMFYAWIMKTEAYGVVAAAPHALEDELLAVAFSSGATAPTAAAAPNTWLGVTVYLLCAVFAPSLFLAFRLLSVWSLNWFILSPVVSYLVVTQLTEYVTLFGALGALRAKQPLTAVLRVLFTLPMVVPTAAWLLSFVLPAFMLQFFIVVAIGHCAVITFMTVLNVFSGIRQGFNDAEADDKREHQK